MTLLLMVMALLVLLLLRVPAAIALLVPSLVYILIDATVGLGTAAQQTMSGVNTFPLLAVPLFILMGNIANVSGISDRLFDAATAIFGRLRGSLGYVNVATSFGFAWMSGAAISDAAAMGRVQVPAMVKRGYPEGFTLGLTASSSLIAPILPPSIPAIIYAVTAGISVGALFVAGIIPALLLMFALCVVVFLKLRKRDDLRLERVSGRERWMPVLTALPSFGTAVIVLGGILGGFFTPTEAAGVAVLYMLLLALCYRSIKWHQLKRALTNSVETGGSVLLIVCAAALFGWVLSREQAPQVVADLIFEITTNPIAFLILLNIALLIVGAVLEPTAAILILVPVLSPVATMFGLEPLHVAVIVIFNLMLGLLTPPVGLVLYVLSSVTNYSVTKVIRGVAPFYGILLLVLVLITFFPFFSTWLPSIIS
ncbi:TRAP transporter large permease [Nesterenkonia salmonea]|uniref:TRAP transporter large permease n=1 Tax=Nesterenkonia salmonea TaxID=1804987 RepID=A0A5R9BKC3_9MICC|nr:TRAP transporter large permease [Nesterenkonia salmonea]TLQ01067.1 TRAP transporter large permease [Nesterenkonia salmonea]